MVGVAPRPPADRACTNPVRARCLPQGSLLVQPRPGDGAGRRLRMIGPVGRPRNLPPHRRGRRRPPRPRSCHGPAPRPTAQPGAADSARRRCRSAASTRPHSSRSRARWTLHPGQGGAAAWRRAPRRPRRTAGPPQPGRRRPHRRRPAAQGCARSGRRRSRSSRSTAGALRVTALQQHPGPQHRPVGVAAARGAAAEHDAGRVDGVTVQMQLHQQQRQIGVPDSGPATRASAADCTAHRSSSRPDRPASAKPTASRRSSAPVS